MSDKVYVGQKAQSFKLGREYEPFSRVTMWYDDEHYYTAGDDTGREMVLECPWATQQIVDSCLSKIKGFVYRPFEATGVELDPAAELGDGITINGHYSMIVQTTEHFDAAGLCDVSAPGEQEVDHEYPYVDPRDRELKRRVKLGQKYQGVKIDRRDGLTITETDGETDGAKVVLNSKKFAFYDAAGQEQLYFDPVAGCYKFRGALNVADNFIVDIHGNVTMKGSINLSDGSITWGGKGPVQYEFSADKINWHPTMQADDKYRRDSLDGGTTWGDPYQFKGEDGRDGANGSEVKVTRANIVLAMLKAIDEDGLYVATINGKQCLGINASAIQTGILEAIKIHGCTITADSTIDVGTDAHVGDTIRLGELGASGKSIIFNDNASISNMRGTESLTISAMGDIKLDAGASLDLRSVGQILWGDHAPTAVFG